MRSDPDRMQRRRGQSAVEYAVLIVLVVAALLAMQLYMKHGIMGKHRQTADEWGEQFSPDAYKANFTNEQYSAQRELAGNGVDTGELKLGKLKTGESVTDAQTKAFDLAKFKHPGKDKKGVASGRHSETNKGETLTNAQNTDKIF